MRGSHAEIRAGHEYVQFPRQDQTCSTRSLSEFKGQNVILCFYSEDNAPEAVAEACAFHDQIDRFQAANDVAMGVSTDDV